MIEVLGGDLGVLARTLAGLIAGRVWPAAAGGGGDLSGLFGAAGRCCSRA